MKNTLKYQIWITDSNLEKPRYVQYPAMTARQIVGEPMIAYNADLIAHHLNVFFDKENLQYIAKTFEVARVSK